MAIVQNWDCTKRTPSKIESVVFVIIRFIGLPARFEVPLDRSYLRRSAVRPRPSLDKSKHITTVDHFRRRFQHGALPTASPFHQTSMRRFDSGTPMECCYFSNSQDPSPTAPLPLEVRETLSKNTLTRSVPRMSIFTFSRPVVTITRSM